MFYLGIDQHKRFSQVAVLDEAGKQVGKARWSHDAPQKIREYVRRFQPAAAALEATRNWDWMFELLEEEVGQVVLSHPARTRLIAEAKIKTDQVDARVLAQLLRIGFLPTAYAPPREVREGRELHRYRMTLVRYQTQLKNRIHALLDRQGIMAPEADLFTRRGAASGWFRWTCARRTASSWTVCCAGWTRRWSNAARWNASCDSACGPIPVRRGC